jgi:uncharacterized protein YjbI with pentapeptide repeats
MRVKNTTPFLFGVKVTSRKPPEPEMTLVVRATYVIAPGAPLRLPDGIAPLAQGKLTADVYREEDEERAGECIYPSDFADFKLSAEVLVKGSCHTPGGRPLTECPARVTVGAWSKALRVVGPRAFLDDALGSEPTAPLPFTRMEISYRTAFGGPGHAENPVGKGFGTTELPNVERFGEPIRSRRDKPAPASFGPLSPTWPQRASLLGREYGEAYRRTRAPYYAEDFDWAHFYAAPPDQRLEGYLRGDEKVAFENLHPDAPRLETTLPGLRIRAFVHDDRGAFREVAMSLDTLFADLDEGRLFLTWRGVTPVREDDLADVTTVLVASEALADPRLPEDGYREALVAFEKDPTGLDENVPGHLQPAWKALANEGGPRAGTPPPDPISALLRSKLGGLSKKDQAKVQKALAAALAVPAAKNANLKGKLDEAALRPPPPVARPAPSPGAAPPLGGALRAMLDRVAALKAEAAAKGQSLPGIEKIEALAADPAIQKLDPSLRKKGPAPDPAPGVDLSGQDLSGRDLSGADLSGANLSDAILTGAKLVGACLSGANLARAILTEADLTDADLSKADLTLSNLGRAKLQNASLKEARLDRASALKADLTGADLSGVQAEGASFEEACLARAKLHGAALEGAVLDRADLEGASLRGARLIRCRLLGAKATGIDMERATLTGSSFDGADLGAARAIEVIGDKTVWTDAKLRSADLSFSSLPEAHFSGCDASGASFRAADLPDCRFYRSKLEGAELGRANLLRADLSKADATMARFSGANLYDAKLTKASLRGTDFSGANLKRSTVERG